MIKAVEWWETRANGLAKAIVVLIPVAFVLSCIPPAAPFGFLLGLVTFVMALVNVVIFRRDAPARKSQLMSAAVAFVAMTVGFVVVGFTAPATVPSPVAAPSPSVSSTATESPAPTPSETTQSVTVEPTETPSAEPSPATTPSESPSSSGERSAPADDGDAGQVLASLAVKGRAPKTGYSREQFGAAWADVDRNGCDTRNDILNRDLTDKTYKSGTHDCVVATGVLRDPYTGGTIDFKRGQNTSTAVQIDHVVALSDAWQKGAQQLSDEMRERLANDPLNLLAVDGPTNQSKSDGDAATWLPPNKSYRCEYVARQVGVKAKYGLWVTQTERDAIAGILASCPGQRIPDSTALPTVAEQAPAPSPTEAPEPSAPAPSPSPTVTQPQQSGGDVSYRNCTAVRAAGKAPLHRGDPGYSSKLDRDGDGVACE